MYWGGGLLLTLLIISGVVSYLGSKTLVLDDVSLREVISNDSLAIYVDDGTAGDDNDDKNYVEYDGDTFPLKADGYKYNADKTTCIDNNGNVTTDVTLYYNNDMIQISTSETVYCYIYFDLYTSNGDWCLANDITDNLGECAIVMDNYYNDVDSAKTAIESKDPVDTSEIAPDITYGKSISTNQTTGMSTNSYFLVGEDYDFNTETGYYTLNDTSKPSILTDNYIGYYTCGDNFSASCTTLYKIISYIVTESGTSVKQTITSADVYTYSVSQSIDSTNGVYMTYDDDGPTYYYRGSVQNNYVLFAGYYWRIVRINGDGSVRMIYAGTDANTTSDDYIGYSKFNELDYDPTYNGYKYGNISNIPITQSSTANFTNFSASTTYYFGTSYEETGSGTFKLSGTIISGTFSGLFGSGGTYVDDITSYYTCFGTKEDSACGILKKLNIYNGSSNANVYYISYASESYEDTLTNSYNSTIKEVVDKWYEEKIKDKYDESNSYLLSEYISTSATFCGDRSVYSGSGYLLSAFTYYNAYYRITKFSPSLYCRNKEDQYSVDNGNLDYPIALISIDEVAFAGGKYASVNTLYYLYTGTRYWTMTPSHWNSGNGFVNIWPVNSTGALGIWYSATTSIGVRPVINLTSNVKISKGTGTASNPFVVTLD